MVNLVIWNEFVHEQEDEHVKSIYPKGIHGCIKEFLSDDKSLNIKTATLEEEDHGLSEELLDKTDVLIWWGHKAHKLVEDKIVDRVQQRVLEGMGLLVLHSGHHSKIFKRMRVQLQILDGLKEAKWKEFGFVIQVILLQRA